MSAPRAVVFDLDGVVRHWNDEELDQVEAAFGLPPRTIITVAFSPELGAGAITGRLSYREWMDEIRRRVVADHGDGVTGALDEWEANVGLVDTEMVGLLRSVRPHATVALLSNGTTRLRRDLHVLDLLDEFDVVFNTAELGIAKPDPDVFRLVCDALRVDPVDALFIDDLADNVAGAAQTGMRSHQHLSPQRTAAFLRAEGVPV